MYQASLSECRNDVPSHEKNANDAIISGDFVVKVLRVATSKDLGPGFYKQEDGIGKVKYSHNIKNQKQFQDLDKIGKNNSTVLNKSLREADKMVSSFYKTEKINLTKIFQEANESAKKMVSPRKASTFLGKTQLSNGRLINISTGEGESNQTITTANESREVGKRMALRKLIRGSSSTKASNIKQNIRKKSNEALKKFIDSNCEQSPISSKKSSLRGTVTPIPILEMEKQEV
jgi:phosphomevalonate kinase